MSIVFRFSSSLERRTRRMCAVNAACCLPINFRKVVKCYEKMREKLKRGLRTAPALELKRKTPHCYINSQSNMKKLIFMKRILENQHIKNQHISTEFISIICLVRSRGCLKGSQNESNVETMDETRYISDNQ